MDLIVDPITASVIATTVVAGTAFAHMAWVDLRTGYLPDIDQIIAALCGLGVAVLGSPAGVGWELALIGGAIGAGLFAGLRWIVTRWKGREAMGEGDIYLAGTAGIWLGPFGLAPMMVWAGGLTLIVTGLLALLRGKEQLSREIPFGPGLIAGIVLTYLGAVFNISLLSLQVVLAP